VAQAQVSIRIDLESGGRIGPGKIALLEAIRKTGSITAAAQSMQMSYRRAWLLVDDLNKLLSEPVVTTAAGGAMGWRHNSYADRREDHRTLPLDRSAHSNCRAQRFSGLSEIDAQLNAGRGGMDVLPQLLVSLVVGCNAGYAFLLRLSSSEDRGGIK
jgi:molybdate transport system regulatory protein